MLQLLQAYGYWAVLGLVMLESFGVPVPAETMLLTAAIYSGQTGRLTIGFVIAAAAVGAILGDNIGYAIGRQGGYRLLRRFLDQRKLAAGQYVFARWGVWVVFFGRFVALLRALAALLAGVNCMPWRRFVIANAAGGIVWSTAYGLLGWALGDAAGRLAGPARTAFIVIGVLAAVVGVVLTVKNERRLEELAMHV